MAKAKFDIKTEATRPFYASVGVTDIAVEFVRNYVTEAQARFADVQKNVSSLDFEPKALREQAASAVNARIEAVTKDAKARQAAIEARVVDLQGDAKDLPRRVQTLVDGNVAAVNDTYLGLVKRGETLVERIRKQEASQATASSAKTTTAKAKTTTTQAKKTTKTAAKKSTTAAKSTAKKSSAPASAKATTTAAKKTTANATQAVADAAKKVGD